MRSLAFAIPIALLALVITGVLFERTEQREDRARYPRIGRSVDIGGRTLNIYCSGEGSPAVVFDTYAHMSGYAWSAVQTEVAKFKQACWYDRAAYGWSDPAPTPRSYQSTASDLHSLLHGAGVPAPYVFVAVGDAALHVRIYHGLYPNEVAGVVMVNANDVNESQAVIPESAKGGFAKHFGSFAPRVRGAACSVFTIVNDVGLGHMTARLQSLRHTDSFGLTPPQQAELDFLSDNPTAKRGSEMCSREEGEEQVRAAGNLGDVPLEVIASRKLLGESSPDESAVAIAWNKHRMEQVQPALARLSSRGRLVVIDGLPDGTVITQAVHNIVDLIDAQHH
jgi:hypothetical protein